MPIYEYETIPARAGDAPRRFEVRQSMSEEPLQTDPETGAPVRRVYAGFSVGGSSKGTGSTHTHTPSCGCGMGGGMCGLN